MSEFKTSSDGGMKHCWMSRPQQKLFKQRWNTNLKKSNGCLLSSWEQSMWYTMSCHLPLTEVRALQTGFDKSFQFSCSLNFCPASIRKIKIHASSHSPWDGGVWCCSPSVDSVSASLPGCCSSNSAVGAHSTHTLHRCQTWAGGEEGGTHIHTHACTPRTQNTHAHHAHTQTQRHTRTDQTWAWCTDVLS